MDVTPVVASAFTGLLAGAIGSIIAPWSQWSVEKRRENRSHRRALIASWRTMISRHASDTPVLRPEGLLGDPDYITLRPYVDSGLLKRLEGPPNQIDVIVGSTGISGSPELAILASEVDRLEREWRLA